VFRSHDPDNVLVSRVDSNDPLASHSKHGFHLDDADWPSVEHYYQAMKFDDPETGEEIRAAGHPAEAARIARKRRRRVRRVRLHVVSPIRNGVTCAGLPNHTLRPASGVDAGLAIHVVPLT